VTSMDSSGLDIPPLPFQPNYPAQPLDRFEGELAITARMWAKDGVGAAMAHQLNEPLTALLLYLHEMKARGERSTGLEMVSNSLLEMVEMALRETERVCDIVERMGRPVEEPVDAGSAIARGREAIDAWRQSGNLNGGAEASSDSRPAERHLLTSREREVLALITSGASNKGGGRQLGISPRTFECHRAHIMSKIGAKNAADLIRMTLSKWSR
jgi:DNA-binding CsgD family transcriptional regulator